MLSNFDESEEELNLDLPLVLNGKMKISNRICDSSEAEQQSTYEKEGHDNQSSNINLSENIDDSDMENSIISMPSSEDFSRTTRNTNKQSKSKQFLSRNYVENSDLDDNPLTLEEMAQKSESVDEGNSFEVDGFGDNIRKSKAHRTMKKEQFVKASEDFKSKLKLMTYDDSETEDSEREFDNDTSKDSYKEIDEAESKDDGNGIRRIKKTGNSMKKPKETLKNVLKESEALLRRSIPIDLEIQVSKPKTLALILNEALAANSRTPAEAKKRAIDEKRRIQRMKLEKYLGPDRMAALIKDDPKIGHSKLDETIEIEVEYDLDEKSVAGEEYSKEILKVKLTDLPDKHFDGKKIVEGSGAGYKAYVQGQKKASIELLNIQLQEKIRAQSNAALLHHQRAQAAHIAAKRAQVEERERKRKENEVRKERELREKKEKKTGGGELFKKQTYEGVERPLVKEGDDNEIFNIYKKPVGRIILSDEEEDEDDGSDEEEDIEDLLNLENDEYDDDAVSQSNLSEGLPDIDEAMGDKSRDDSEGLNSLLSGKFAEEQNDSEAGHLDITNKRMKSIFIDDEASDENEERENDEIDEEALQEEMKKSNFIVESCESDLDPAELRAFLNKKSIEEDGEINQKIFAKFGNHLDEGGEEEEFLNSLGNKYGLNEGGDSELSMKSKKRSLVSKSSLDEDIRKLLDPIEQKKRKLAALGSLNIFNRTRQIEAASEEFQFVKKPTVAAISDCSSDYYATDDSDVTDGDSDNENGRGYYEEVESGLQSRVEEMLDEEMLDGEEVQVQATESLSAHLKTISNNEMENNNQNMQTRNHGIQTSNQNTKTTRGGVAVPTADAKLKSKLLALQQENDEIVLGNNSEKFKGFSFSKK